MPRSNFTQRGVATGSRRCPQCGDVWPALGDYFYERGNGRLELCQGPATRNCRTRYFREYAARTRATRAATIAAAGQSGRKFGVELEFIGSASAVCRAMRAAGLECNQENYGHSVPRAWKIVPDSSVRNGAELVSPPLSGDAGRDEVRRACAALVAAGATVNGSTGLHVHHDATDLTVRAWGRLFRLWAACQDGTDAILAPSRRRTGGGGHWAQPLTDRHVMGAEALARNHPADRPLPTGAVYDFISRGDRYYSLNADPYGRQGTIECRQHQGTTNGAKVLAWIEYAQAFFAYAQGDGPIPGDGTDLAATLAALSDHGALSPVTAAYLTTRAATIARRATRERATLGASAVDDTCTDDYSACQCSECVEDRGETPATGDEW